MSRWQLISFFGESAFLVPCAVFLYGWLRWRRAPGIARHWLLAFSVTALVVLGSKLAFLGWGIGSEAIDFTGFSGHAMMAASVLPVLLYLTMPAGRPRLGWLAAAAGVLMALAVGASRLMLHAHSVSEVISGLALGFCVSLPFIMRREVPRGPVTLLLASATLVSMLVLPVHRVAGVTHVWVQELAVFLSGRDRPYQRGEWAAMRPRDADACMTGVAHGDGQPPPRCRG